MMRPLRLPRTECAHGSAFHLRLFPLRWAMRGRHFSAVLIALLLPVVSWAAPGDAVDSCDGVYQWASPFNSPGWKYSPAEAFSDWEDAYCAVDVDREPCIATDIGFNTSTQRWYGKMEYTNSLGNRAKTTTTNLGRQAIVGSCPAPDCVAGEGWLTQVATNDIAATESAYAGTCFNDCKIASAKAQSVGIDCDSTGACSYVIVLRNEGGACDAEPPATPAPDPLDPDPITDEPTQGQEYCVTSANGTEACASDAYGENCGYVNDKFVCLGKTDPDECWVNDDGSRLCGESAPSPPVPDNGTRGTKATPDDTVGAKGPDGSTNTYNYYNSTTVAGSSVPAGDSGANPNRPGSTNPSSSTQPVAEQGGGGGGLGDGDGEFPTNEEVCTFGDCLTTFYNSVSEGPWGQTVSFGAIGGSCPSYSFSAYGETFDFDVICVWYEDVKPMLAIMVTLVGLLVGFRIVMSA